MRLVLVGLTTVFVGIAACSDRKAALPGGEPDAAATTPASNGAGQATSFAAATPGGTSLTGEVSGLTGEITGFRVEETPTSTIVEIAADVLFAFDRAELSPGATQQLSRTAALIQAGGASPVVVRGYTDAKGEDAYNLDLSRRRAQAVVNWLSTTGAIDAPRLTAEGLGEADPVAPNASADGADNPEGRARNRRVTVTIPKT
ncbi:hypothetical protein BH10PSE1_BH10PSE1_00060 [soil metagenome]